MGRMLAKRRSSASVRLEPTSLSGIAPGDYVRITWRYDPAYGNGEGSFEGKVTELDSWITVKSPHNVLFYWPVRGLEVKKIGAVS
jgi:hypothetical protein